MNLKRILIALTAALAIAACSASSASAAEPWWHLISTTRPSLLSSNPETKGELVLTAINLGTGPAAGETTPIRLEDILPEGVRKLRSRPSSPPAPIRFARRWNATSAARRARRSAN